MWRRTRSSGNSICLLYTSFERAEDAKAFIEEGYRTGQRGDHFTVGPMKLIQDGSLGARTAAMNEPYEDSPENTGIITFSQDELDEDVYKRQEERLDCKTIFGTYSACPRQKSIDVYCPVSDCLWLH